MASSLDKLIFSLPKDSFKHLDHFFPDTMNLTGNFFIKKFQCLQLFETHEKYLETRLPDLQYWTILLHGRQVTIISDNLLHAQYVFDTFEKEKLGDYQNLYLLTGTLLLTCAFELLREMTFSTYGLDSTH